MVLILLALLLITIHTAQTTYAIFYQDKKQADFLVGAEDGCCGLVAVGLSFYADDEGKVKAKSNGAKRRIISRILTLGLQLPIIVVVCKIA